MGFYFRKNMKIGKLINLSFSKSGVGISAGVKGFRIGKGPKGNYISMGKDGIYYRKYFGGKSKASNKKANAKTNNKNVSESKNISDINTYNTENVVDTSSRELIETIRANMKKLFGRKTTIYYDIDEETENRLQSFYDSFSELEDCDKMWYVFSKDESMTNNYHQLDSKNLIRTEISIKYSMPKFIKTNVTVPCINAGNQQLYFLPDKMLIVEGKQVGALSYNSLNITVEHGNFKEDGQKPSDAKIIETTYKYTNKNGEQDKRYSYNPKTYILEYTYIYFTGNKGFNECIMLSKNNIGEKLKFEVEKMKSVMNFKENEEQPNFNVKAEKEETIKNDDGNRKNMFKI